METLIPVTPVQTSRRMVPEPAVGGVTVQAKDWMLVRLKLLVRVMVGLKTPGSAVMVPEMRPVAGLMVRPVGRPVAE